MLQYYCNICPPFIMVPGELRRGTGADMGGINSLLLKKPFQGSLVAISESKTATKDTCSF